AIYMSLTMLVSFIATRLSPETLNRDLTDPEDARHSYNAVAEATTAATGVTVAEHVK
ncbi:MAG TPA: MFS transporter, partial [Arthrobacter bacterium]|nr:MFS transporter [Arthrobacter sp.]